MATGSTMTNLSVESIRALTEQSAGGKFLAGCILVCTEPDAEDTSIYVVCNVVYGRDGGFMFVAPEWSSTGCEIFC